MVTAELALSLLGLVLLVCAATWGGAVLVQQVEAHDVAAQVARQLARGDRAAAEQLLAQHPDLRVTWDRRQPLVEVTVVDPGQALGVLPAVATTARATAVLEPGQ